MSPTPPFSGFQAGKVQFTGLPAPFFRQLLPQIDHLGELKVVLYFFWRLDQMEGTFRYLRRKDLLADTGFLDGLGDEPETNLEDSLQRAVERGVLLRCIPDGSSEPVYFLNSPKGRAAVEAIEKGDWRPSGLEDHPLELLPERPNIFQLYEDNIGPLSPLIADALRDTEQQYPADWIEEAVRLSVELNKRSWRYVTAILDRWQREGRNERQDRRDSQKDRRRYAEWNDSGDE